VIHDFLPKIARTDVLEDIEAGSKPRLFSNWYTPRDAPVALPIEFAAAAFRFGHSMVQDGYSLNRHLGGVDSSEIVRMTKRGGGITSQLPADYVIDWQRFFGSGAINHAAVIDTFISEMLYDLPKQTEEAFRFQISLAAHFRVESEFVLGGKMRPVLPELTLKRGSKIGLPSGEEFATKFKYDALDAAQLFPGRSEFFKSDLNERTPLWYYLLREAAIEPNSESPVPPSRLQQQKLGTVGSRIVAETLYQLLKADAESIANRGQGWQPPLFKFGVAGTEWCINSLAELSRFVEAAG
jgi:hypothetical protein